MQYLKDVHCKLLFSKLISNIFQDSHEFVQKIKTIYDEINSRMATDFPQWVNR